MSTGPLGHPRPSIWRQPVVRVLVVVGALGVLAMVGRLISVGWTWYELYEIRRTGFGMKAPAKEGHVSGCDHAYVYDPSALGGHGAPHYLVSCINGHGVPLPTCDEVVARYIAAHGPLPDDVRVTVRHKGNTSTCDQAYAGDGSPK